MSAYENNNNNNNQNIIYLDNAASTPIHVDVIKEMIPFLYDNYGNPSSLHRSGRITSNAILKARNRVSKLIGSSIDEIFFTSGGTESNNLALIGYAIILSKTNPYLNKYIVSEIEHDSILEPIKKLEKEMNFTIEYVPVNRDGFVNIDKFSNMITPNTGLVSIMLVNNEIGTIQPIHKLAVIAKEKNKKIVFHTDGVQALGKIPIDVRKLNIDMMSISSHKINGPKGVGALYIKRGLKVESLLHGGGQEIGLRSGTENVAGIIGFGMACNISELNFPKIQHKIKELQKYMVEKILLEIPHSTLNGSLNDRIPNNLNFSFSGITGEDLLIKLDEYGIEVSTGSACSSNKKQKASHVLKALGLGYDKINGSIRLTIGYQNTLEDIEKAIEILKLTIFELRELNNSIYNEKIRKLNLKKKKRQEK